MVSEAFLKVCWLKLLISITFSTIMKSIISVQNTKFNAFTCFIDKIYTRNMKKLVCSTKDGLNIPNQLKFNPMIILTPSLLLLILTYFRPI